MKRIMILGFALILIFSLTACRQQPVETPEEETPNVVVDPDPAPAPQEEMEEVTLYYMNYEYIVTGDESLDKAIPIKREVVMGDKSLVEIILEELQKEPEEESLTTALANLRILSVETTGNTVYVDLSSEELHGGSLEESSILTQLILSLTELPEIEEVQIYVDGSTRDTLMSHYEIRRPLTREDIGY